MREQMERAVATKVDKEMTAAVDRDVTPEIIDAVKDIVETLSQQELTPEEQTEFWECAKRCIAET